MPDGEQQPQNGKPEDGSRRFMIRLAWGMIIFYFVGALVATWFRGLGPEVLFGWIILVYLGALTLLVAYDARKTLLGVGTLLLAAIFFGTSFFHEEGWSVNASQLQYWGIGSAACAVGVLAYDAKKNRASPFVADVAGVFTFLGLFIYGFIVHEHGLSVVAGTKGVLSSVVIVGLYSLTDKRWRNILAIAALFPIIMLLIKSYEAGLLT